jgi:hypothetical protein
MRMKLKALARRTGRVLVVTAMIITGVVVLAPIAHAAVPTVTSVLVLGSTTNRVVTAGTNIVITGTGFAGMKDSAANPACSVTPVASSGCSQVRFNGLSANTNATGYTLGTDYVVVSDTKIHATVPTIAALAPATGAPTAGAGSIRVVVVNTVVGGGSSLISAAGTTAATELFYRHPLTATLQSASVTPSPLGGGTIAVDVGNIAPITTGNFVYEKITARFTSTVSGSTNVLTSSVTFVDTDTVNVVVPAGTPTGDYVEVTLLHEGIAGTGDSDSLKYPATITAIQTCTAFTPPVTTTLPSCTGAASSAASTFYTKLTGKGLTAATAFTFDGSGGTTTETCSVYSHTIAYCVVDVAAAPPALIAVVSFTPGDPDDVGPATAPTFAATGSSSVFVFS